MSAGGDVMSYGTRWRHVGRAMLLAAGCTSMILCVSALGTTLEGKWSWWSAGVLLAGCAAFPLIFLAGLGVLASFRVRVRGGHVEHALCGVPLARRPVTRFVLAVQSDDGTRLMFDDGRHLRVVGVPPDEFARMNEGLLLAAANAREAARAGCDAPPRPVAVDPSWLTWQDGAVPAIAHALARDPDGHGVLADALEDAGCRDEALLAHLRRPGPHVEGCWALALASRG